MPIIKAVQNPQSRQILSFHKLLGLATDRASWYVTTQLCSWINEEDYNQNPQSPVSIEQLVFWPNQVDVARRPVSNMDELIENHWKAYQLTKSPWQELTREQFEVMAKNNIPQDEEYIARDRRYEFDMKAPLEHIYSDIYAIIEKFPIFSISDKVPADKTKASTKK